METAIAEEYATILKLLIDSKKVANLTDLLANSLALAVLNNEVGQASLLLENKANPSTRWGSTTGYRLSSHRYEKC